MAGKPTTPAADRRGRSADPARTSIPAAEFKARCLELMDGVRETDEGYVVTKHGKPGAMLVRYTSPPKKKKGLFGSMKGTVLSYERPFDPIDGEWDVNRD